MLILISLKSDSSRTRQPHYFSLNLVKSTCWLRALNEIICSKGRTKLLYKLTYTHTHTTRFIFYIPSITGQMLLKTYACHVTWTRGRIHPWNVASDMTIILLSLCRRLEDVIVVRVSQRACQRQLNIYETCFWHVPSRTISGLRIQEPLLLRVKPIPR